MTNRTGMVIRTSFIQFMQTQAFADGVFLPWQFWQVYWFIHGLRVIYSRDAGFQSPPDSAKPQMMVVALMER